MNSKIVLLLVPASGDDHQMNASAVACCMLLKMQRDHMAVLVFSFNCENTERP